MNKEDLKEIKAVEKELSKLQETMYQIDELTDTVDSHTVANIQIGNDFIRVPGDDWVLLLGFYSKFLHQKVSKKEQQFDTMLKRYIKK